MHTYFKTVAHLSLSRSVLVCLGSDLAYNECILDCSFGFPGQCCELFLYSPDLPALLIINTVEWSCCYEGPFMKAFIFLTYISCLENNNNLIQDLIDWISTAATQTVSFLANIGGIFCGHKQLIGGYHLHLQKVCLLWLEHVSETCCITFSAGFWFGFSAGMDFTQGNSVSLRILHNFETHKPTVELLGS